MSALRQYSVCQNVRLANAMKARLQIGERRQTGLLVLAPVGRIDNRTSAKFRRRLLAAVSSYTEDVVIDFSGVEYISSCGLHALMTASRRKPATAAARRGSSQRSRARDLYDQPVHASCPDLCHGRGGARGLGQAAAAQARRAARWLQAGFERTTARALLGHSLGVHCRRRCANLRYAARSGMRCSRCAAGPSTRRRRLTTSSTVHCPFRCARHLRRQYELRRDHRRRR